MTTVHYQLSDYSKSRERIPAHVFLTRIHLLPPLIRLPGLLYENPIAMGPEVRAVGTSILEMRPSECLAVTMQAATSVYSIE